ncbi:hypothetical protein ACFCX0_46490 [Streptomyces sp. NPDC056352]|uniref:hypothetical protein n=1 Tax=Streptomyces sp. NPDC056352 TaxID=3345791 RepID=UPI0035D66187
MAEALGVRERAVWRWSAAAEQDESAAAAPGERTRYYGRFTTTPEVRALLGLWRGNVAAAHRELTARAARGEGEPPPSIPTLHRAIRRDLSLGERAGPAGGEREARRHDVFLSRPRGWRNQVWEADHVQAPVLIDVEGTALRPWITWFVDCATNAITGVAVTPGSPSRESVLTALRAAVVREKPFGPQGGLPERARAVRGALAGLLRRHVEATSRADWHSSAFDHVDLDEVRRREEEVPFLGPFLGPFLARAVLDLAAADATAGVPLVERMWAWTRIAAADVHLHDRVLASHLAAYPLAAYPLAAYPLAAYPLAAGTRHRGRGGVVGPGGRGHRAAAGRPPDAGRRPAGRTGA